MYCQVVMTPWEQAIWLYEASEQNVDWVMDGVEWSGVDTPQTVMTTRAPAVLTNEGRKDRMA